MPSRQNDAFVLFRIHLDNYLIEDVMYPLAIGTPGAQICQTFADKIFGEVADPVSVKGTRINRQ